MSLHLLDFPRRDFTSLKSVSTGQLEYMERELVCELAAAADDAREAVSKRIGLDRVRDYLRARG